MAGNPALLVIGGASVQIPNNTDLGYIKDGLHLSKEEEVYYVTGIEGLPTPPVAHRTSIQYTMSGTLIEPTLANIKLVYGGTDVTTPVSMGLVGEMDVVTNGINNVLFTTYAPVTPGANTLREIEATKAVADGPGEMVFTDAEEVSLPFTFKVIWDGTQSLVITDS